MKLSNNALVVVLHNKNIKYLEKFKKNLNKDKHSYDIICFCDNISKKFKNYDNFIFLNLKKKKIYSWC